MLTSVGTSVLTDSIKPVFDFLLSSMSSVLDTVVANPILLLPIGAMVVGMGIGIFRKLT